MSLSTSGQGTTNINGSGSTGAGGSFSGFSTSVNSSVLIGQNCATNDSSGYSNTFVGNFAAANSIQGSGNVVMGFATAPNLYGDNNVIIGKKAANGTYVRGFANVVIGNVAAPSLVGGFSNVMIGTGVDMLVDANNMTVIGSGASSTGFCVAIGYKSQNQGLHSIAIGDNATTGTAGSIALGTRATAVGAGSISIGYNAKTPNKDSLAIGSNVSATVTGSMNILNRVVGYFSPINTSTGDLSTLNKAPSNATYVLQANVDALKITGGGVIAFCKGAGGGVTNGVQADPDPQWVVGMSSNDLAFTSSNGAVVKLVDDFRPGLLDFTAQHRCVWTTRDTNVSFSSSNAGPAALPLAGRVVIANGGYRSTGGATIPTADEAVPTVELATEPMDAKAFGVLSSDPANEYRIGHLVFQKEMDEADRTVVVNSAGEGGIWVSDENGPIRNGDLVTTGSSIPGVAVRQNDDLVHSYTVAKITCDEPFLFGENFFANLFAPSANLFARPSAQKLHQNTKAVGAEGEAGRAEGEAGRAEGGASMSMGVDEEDVTEASPSDGRKRMVIGCVRVALLGCTYKF